MFSRLALIFLFIILIMTVLTILPKFQSIFPIMKILCSSAFVFISFYLSLYNNITFLLFNFAFVLCLLGDIFLIHPEYDILRISGFTAFFFAQSCFFFALAFLYSPSIFILTLLLLLALFIALIIIICGTLIIKLDFQKDAIIAFVYATMISLTMLLSIYGHIQFRTPISFALMVGLTLFFISDLVLSNVYYDKNNKYVDTTKDDISSLLVSPFINFFFFNFLNCNISKIKKLEIKSSAKITAFSMINIALYFIGQYITLLGIIYLYLIS